MKKLAVLVAGVMLLGGTVFADGHETDAMKAVSINGASKVTVENDILNEDSDTTLTLTLTDMTATFNTLPENVAASVQVLDELGKTGEADMENTMKLRPKAEMTIETVGTVSIGTDGTLDDDWMITKTGDEDAEIGMKLYANYSYNELYTGLTVGAENDFKIEKTGGDDESTNTITMKPYANYEMAITDTVNAGAESSIEFSKAGDDDMGNTLTVKPYANLSSDMGNGLTVGSDNSFEISKADTADDATMTLLVQPSVTKVQGDLTFGAKGDDDDGMLKWTKTGDNDASTIIQATGYAEHTGLFTGLTAGGELTFKSETVEGGDATNTTTIKPYVNYTMVLTENLNMISENSFEVVKSGANNLSLMAGVEYKF